MKTFVFFIKEINVLNQIGIPQTCLSYSKCGQMNALLSHNINFGWQWSLLYYTWALLTLLCYKLILLKLMCLILTLRVNPVMLLNYDKCMQVKKLNHIMIIIHKYNMHNNINRRACAYTVCRYNELKQLSDHMHFHPILYWTDYRHKIGNLIIKSSYNSYIISICLDLKKACWN